MHPLGLHRHRIPSPRQHRQGAESFPLAAPLPSEPAAPRGAAASSRRCRSGAVPTPPALPETAPAPPGPALTAGLVRHRRPSRLERAWDGWRRRARRGGPEGRCLFSAHPQEGERAGSADASPRGNPAAGECEAEEWKRSGERMRHGREGRREMGRVPPRSPPSAGPPAAGGLHSPPVTSCSGARGEV